MNTIWKVLIAIGGTALTIYLAGVYRYEVGLILLVVAGSMALAGLVFVVGLALMARHLVNRKRYESDEARARADKARLEAGVLVTVADPGQQVYLTQANGTTITIPLHLIPGRINGHPSAFDRDEVGRYELFNVAHGRAARQAQQVAQLAPPEEGPSLAPILPKLTPAQRLIITGGSDAGKSTLVKHLIASRADHSQIVMIDPHSPSKVLGIDVIGAGRDYEAIANALQSLVWMMTSRYTDVAEGLMGYGQHARVSVFIEEWTSIQRKVERAGEYFETLLTESRKVNIHLTVITHSPNVDTLGISAAIRKSAILVELIGGQGEPHRAFIHPNSKVNPDGSKARPVEYALPGPFPGYAQPAGKVVLELPDARVLQAQAMHAAGESVTAIAREFYDTDKPNGRQLQEIKELLKRADEARRGHDNATT
jgi:hypothetical protein